jgi:hypothetical protein
MNLKRLIGSVAIAGVVSGSALGVGAGVASASTSEGDSGVAVVQPTDWHGHGHGYGHGRDYRGGWPINRWWHRWGGPWHW